MLLLLCPLINRHGLSQETNKLAKETKGCFQKISEYTRTSQSEQQGHRQVYLSFFLFTFGSSLM